MRNCTDKFWQIYIRFVSHVYVYIQRSQLSGYILHIDMELCPQIAIRHIDACSPFKEHMKQNKKNPVL